MSTSTALLPASDALADIEAVLDRVDSNRTGLDAASRLSLVRRARRVRDRVDALATLLTAEADRANASLQATGTPLNSWLGMGEALSRREAAAAVGQARTLAAYPEVAEAAAAGTVRAGQAKAIGKVLSSLAPQLKPSQQAHAARVMVELATQLDAEQLARSADRVLAQVSPAKSDELAETRLQREAEAAQRARSLRLWREGGSMRFEGSLPRFEGERFLTLINAHAERLRRTAIESRDPLSGEATPEQRRADAFVAVLGSVESATPAPGMSGARVIVKLDYQRLQEAAVAAGVIGEDEHLSAGELRRVCCDAEIVPIVLGSVSEVLDVGRSARLVTAGIRTALMVRDSGCAFPGCGVRPELCEAHHVTPWWAGGATALSNLVLLCHTHHGVVEPAKAGIRDQWEVEIGPDGAPRFIPPRRLDHNRLPLAAHRRTPLPAEPPPAPHRRTPQETDPPPTAQRSATPDTDPSPVPHGRAPRDPDPPRAVHRRTTPDADPPATDIAETRPASGVGEASSRKASPSTQVQQEPLEAAGSRTHPDGHATKTTSWQPRTDEQSALARAG